VLKVVAVMPTFQILTKEAREALPQILPFAYAVHNVEKVAYLVSSLQVGDFDAMRYAMSDKLHEQFRARLIPGYDDVKKAGRESGALSVNISGAGSTVVAFTLKNEEQIGKAMVSAFAKHDVKASYQVLTVENEGAVVMRF
jgi:homoserine kinase